MEHIVYCERYFCYPIGEWRNKNFFSAVVMMADVEKGGDPNLIDRTICADIGNVRIAEEADYERFKIALL